MYVGKQSDVKGGDYLGTVSQIYDNVNGNEAQFLSFQTSNNDCASMSFRKIV